MDRNARLYPLYAALFSAFFWLPIFFLYFASGLPVARVLQLEAIYYAGVVLLEVPSGYFSDTVGRRPTLLISAAALTAAYGLFAVGDGFGALALAQLLLAAGIAFNSGTDTSFHYDSLAAAGRDDEYGVREAAVGRRAFLAGAAASIIGGAVGLIDLRLAYVLSCIAAAASLVIVFAFKEPPRARGSESADDGATAHRPTFRAQLGATLGELRRPSLAWLTAYMVLMIVLNHVPYEFYQPYLRLLSHDVTTGSIPGSSLAGTTAGSGSAGLAPFITGLHAAAAMLIASWLAGRSIRIRDRLGTVRTLLSATALQAAIIVALGAILSPIVAVFAVLRGAPRALMAAPFNAAVTPRIDQSRRATFLSVQSLAGRLAFSGTLLLLSTIGPAGEPTWAALSPRLRVAALIAMIGLAIMWATRNSLSDSLQAANP